MRLFIVTDLEGVAGVDSFSQTRTSDEKLKAPAMRQLTAEVNACIAGIHSVYPEAIVDVWDGHGSGGLIQNDLVGGNYIRGGRPYYDIEGYAGLLFVGQHAMSGSPLATLCHTFSSLRIAYYRVNGVFIGEFGALTLVAGTKGVPTIFLSGDDKAAYEARMFVPEIETAVVKWGKGLETAVHRDPDEACVVVHDAAARAIRRIAEIPPFTGIQPPYTVEIRYYEPSRDRQKRWVGPDVTWLDERTVQITSDDLRRFQF